jgi:hypothetical protein
VASFSPPKTIGVLSRQLARPQVSAAGVGSGKEASREKFSPAMDPFRGPEKQGTPALGRKTPGLQASAPARPKPAPPHSPRPACQRCGIADQIPGCRALGTAHPMNRRSVHLGFSRAAHGAHGGSSTCNCLRTGAVTTSLEPTWLLESLQSTFHPTFPPGAPGPLLCVWRWCEEWSSASRLFG